jgi:acetaldehyde dehydrogenase (acetylating)
MNHKAKVAIIGPGNIGTDLMIKVMRKAVVQNLDLVDSGLWCVCSSCGEYGTPHR